MPGSDVFMEQLFTMKRLEDFVPADHPLRPIRLMVDEALVRLDGLFSGMYACGAKAVAPALRWRNCCGPCCCRCSTASVRTAIDGAGAVQPAVPLAHRSVRRLFCNRLDELLTLHRPVPSRHHRPAFAEVYGRSENLRKTERGQRKAALLSRCY